MSNKPLLLVVDDDPLISDALSYAFAAEYDVVTSHARPHCLTLLQQLRRTPQAALVDLGLPPLPHRPDEGFAPVSYTHLDVYKRQVHKFTPVLMKAEEVRSAIARRAPSGDHAGQRRRKVEGSLTRVRLDQSGGAT